MSTKAAGVPGPGHTSTSREMHRFHYRKLIAFQAGVLLVRDAHLYTGHFQGQDLAFEFDKSTFLILNITADTFHNSLSFIQTVKLRKRDQAPLEFLVVTVVEPVDTKVILLWERQHSLSTLAGIFIFMHCLSEENSLEIIFYPLLFN